MFYYFGRKKRLAKAYPEPEHDLVIEPFAGSGAYSLHGDRWQRDVWLNDLDERIVGLWRYLQAAAPTDIEALPSVQPGDLLSDHVQLTPEERLLISLHAGPGKNKMNDVVSKFSRWEPGRRYIIESLHKIKHWRVTGFDYRTLPQREATWFVDPPYQRSGRLYRHHDIDFGHLATWVKTRHGQMVVCEQRGADWLPFESLASIHIAGRHVSHEMVWLPALVEQEMTA